MIELPLKVESLAVWGDTLFVGTHEGVLMVYIVQYNRNAEKAKRFTYTLSHNTRKDFAKKSIIQLCPIPEIGMLVSLADGNVRVHTLGSLREVSVLQKQGSIVKGCTMFAIKKEKGEYTMIIALKTRHALIAKYDVKEMCFKFVQELQFGEVARSVIWSGKTLCVGFKREYCRVNPETGATASLFMTGPSQSNVICKSIPGEIILTRENIAISLNYDAKPKRQHGIAWSDEPSRLSYMEPFLIAPVGSFLEVRILSNHKGENLVQTIGLNSVAAMSQPNFIDFDEQKIDDGVGLGYKKKKKYDPEDDIIQEKRLFLATKNNVYVMPMKQVYMQVEELQSKKEFHDALFLINYFEGTEYELKPSQISGVHFDYGLHLFTQGEFEKSMENFSKTSDDPRFVISLFPDLLPKVSNFNIDLPFSSPDEKKKVKKLLSDKEKRMSALNALIPFLTLRRVPPSMNLSGEDFFIAEAVDSALLKTMLYTNDSSLVQFIESPNRVNISDSEAALLFHKRYHELISFYKTKGLHEKALVMLKNMAEHKSAIDDPTTRDFEDTTQTIRYLTGMKENPELIKKYSRWVLKSEPIIGLQIFTHKDCPFSVIEVLSHLDSIEGGLHSSKISYLEYIVNEENSKDSELHNLMASFYLEYIIHNIQEEFEQDEVLKKLKIFLSNSKYYNPEKLLSKFPFDSLLEERAILLSRINRHAQALSIYVNKLRRPDLAEKYCVDHFNSGSEECKEIFIILLKMYLKPELPNEAPQIVASIKIMERHYDKIDAIKALSMLYEAKNVSVQEIEKYLYNVLRKLEETRRSTQVLKNLAASANLKQHELNIRERRRKVKVKYNRICQVCNKRIGLSAFACYPNGTVTHYVCSKDAHIDPVSERNFLRESLLRPNFSEESVTVPQSDST